jgi:signal transduction histidine kinase
VDVARLSARALGVKRTSIWLLDSTAAVLRCSVDLRDLRQFPSTLSIATASCPAYLHALETQTAIAVDDAGQDERIRELASYLQERTVGALLHVPLRVPGTHDFNNLLTVMSHQTCALQRGLGRDDPNSYTAMEQALEQATALVRALLTYGRREARRPQTLCVDELLDDTKSLLQAMTRGRVELSLSLRAEQACVRADRTGLRQVLINLVTNAADAAHGAGGQVRIASHTKNLSEKDAWEKGLLAGGEIVVICVTDNGGGIDPGVLKHIFEPFFHDQGRRPGHGPRPRDRSVRGQCGGRRDSGRKRAWPRQRLSCLASDGRARARLRERAAVGEGR